MPALLERFLASLPGATAPAEAGVLLERLLSEGRQGWPGVVVDDEAFLRHLAARLPPGQPVAAALAQVHGRDLYLACACGQGLPAALAAFDKALLSQVPAWIGHMAPSSEEIGEIQQILRDRLFLPGRAGEPAKIADYSGRGALHSWVRIAVLRTALSLRRGDRHAAAATADLGDELQVPLRSDPEMEFIKQRYRGEFQGALHQAFATLSAEQRNVLRLHYVDGLNIDRIGAMLRVHRSTVARWLAASCAQMFDETRHILRERLRLSQAEFDSLAEILRSRLDVSIVRLLREQAP